MDKKKKKEKEIEDLGLDIDWESLTKEKDPLDDVKTIKDVTDQNGYTPNDPLDDVKTLKDIKNKRR